MGAVRVGLTAPLTQIGTINQWLAGSADQASQEVLTFADNAPIDVSDSACAIGELRANTAR